MNRTEKFRFVSPVTCFFMFILGAFATGPGPVATVQAAQGPEASVNCTSANVDQRYRPLLEWFPRPLPGWESCPGEIFLHTESLIQVHKKYRRLSDGAELEILVLAVTGPAAKAGNVQGLTDRAWERIAMVMGGETFFCQGYKGIVITQDGKTVLKFILRDKHLEIDLMLDKEDKDAVKRYGSLLNINRAARLFLAGAALPSHQP